MRVQGVLQRALIVFAVTASACAPAAQPAQPTPAATTAPSTGSQAQPTAAATKAPQVKQTLIIGMPTLPSVLDSMANLGLNPRRYGLYEMLVGQKADGSVEPMLAASWKTLDPNTWQFTLALSGHKFHDGTPVTAEDIKFSLDRAKDPNTKLGINSRMITIDSIDIVNPTTLNITTKEPDGLLLKRAAYVPIFPKAYFEKVGPDEFGIKPIGSGPFKVKEWAPNDHLTYVGIPDHPAHPTLTEMTFKQIGEASARIAGLRTGELDMINAPPLEQVESLKSAGFNAVVIDAGSSNGFFMDPIIPGAPTADSRVRQAINYAVDKEAIAKNIFKGLVKPDAGQPLQPETFGYNPNVKMYPYDPAMAKKLLAEAGYPNGFKISMEVYRSSPEWESIGLFVQQQLKDVGIEVDLQVTTDVAAWLDHFYGRKPRPELLSVGLLSEPAMDADYALIWFKGSQPVPVKHYDNPEFDKYYNPSITETNDSKRLQLLQQAVKVLHDDPPMLFLNPSAAVWMFKKDVAGVERRTDQEPDFAKVKRTA